MLVHYIPPTHSSESYLTQIKASVAVGESLLGNGFASWIRQDGTLGQLGNVFYSISYKAAVKLYIFSPKLKDF